MTKYIYYLDDYGVKNYYTRFLAFASFGTLYLVIALFAYLLFHYEMQVTGSNITSYGEAFWCLQMAASTIGFGDVYPVSQEGRIITAAMFYIGVGLVGYIGAIVAEKVMGFSDTNIKNRELRLQNERIMQHNLELEAKLDQLILKMESLGNN